MLYQNTMLVFFVVSGLFLSIGGTLRLLHSLDGLNSGSGVANFVDLCTMANTSIIIVKEQMFGYYIHGKAPWGQSDIPLEVLQKQIFEHPKENKGGKRGLEKQTDPKRIDDQVQTFRIYLPYDMLEKLQQIRKELTRDDNEDYEDPNKV